MDIAGIMVFFYFPLKIILQGASGEGKGNGNYKMGRNKEKGRETDVKFLFPYVLLSNMSRTVLCFGHKYKRLVLMQAMF